ncbi:MAG TPA: signal peptide peptidase SppA [Jatrophihabitantaceae bacterium]|jgi:protease-4
MPNLPGHRPPALLELDLTSVPVAPDPEDVIARFRARGHHQLRPTLRALHEAAGDRHVRGLIVKVGGALPWATMQELRLGVAEFAASGKPTVAWAESFGEDSGDMSAYVLATAFDEVWLQPSGTLGLLGIGVETTFLRGALDKLDLHPEIEQRHEYKNAPDTLLRTEYSDAHRTAMDRLAGSIFDDAVSAIAAARGLSEEQVRELADTGPRLAQEALDAGLVDRLGYRDEVYRAVRARFGDDVQLLFADRWTPRRKPSVPTRRKGHVALVEIRGGIAIGRSVRGPLNRRVGSDSVSNALRAAGRDEHARAVLLHVDSPGGSAVASDTIWREVCQLRELGKPVVVSMGQYAASGGYFVACPADVIVALPATLTGSIGVFGGKVVVNDLLERFGVTTDSVVHGARSLMFSTRRRFTPDEHERLVAAIDTIYADFVAKVAQGRRRDPAEIEPLARGRVWTGRDALERGLVDELGGLRTAARIARKRGNLPPTAPIRHAVHVPPMARLGRPRNSEDPRAQVTTALPSWRALASALGLPEDAALRMPALSVR